MPGDIGHHGSHGPHAGRQRATRHCRTSGTLLALLTAALLALSACTGDDPGDDPDGTTQSTTLRLRTVHTAGEIDEEARTRVETAIGDVLSQYVVRAFLGDYPRQDFVSSFDDFTLDTAGKAARHIEVLTGAGFADASSVRASALGADLSLLSPEGRVIGATAAVRFRFEVTKGESEATTVTLSGQLMLVLENGAWSVFGYEVALDDGGAIEAEVSS